MAPCRPLLSSWEPVHIKNGVFFARHLRPPEIGLFFFARHPVYRERGRFREGRIEESGLGLWFRAVDFDFARAVDFARGPLVSASYFEWAFTNTRPDFLEGGPICSTPKLACISLNPIARSRPVMRQPWGHRRRVCPPAPNQIVMRLHANWGHAKRAPADSDVDNMHLLTCVDEVSDQCGAFGKAPHVRIAGASSASMFNEKNGWRALYFWAIASPCVR